MIKLLFLIILISSIFCISFQESFSQIKKYQILDNVEPYKTGNTNSDIAFVSLHTNNIKNYAKYSEIALIKYCEKWNYGYYIYNKSLSNDVEHGCWNKIPAIQNHLKDHKYIIWMDADAIINDFNIDIKQYISGHEDKQLICCGDIQKHYPINSGVMIIKNSDFSNKLLTETWNWDGKHGYNEIGDQVILRNNLAKLSNNNLITSKEKKNYYKIYPERTFNTHPRLTKFETHKKNEILNDFIIHYMGYPSSTRVEHFKKSLDRNNIKY